MVFLCALSHVPMSRTIVGRLGAHLCRLCLCLLEAFIYLKGGKSLCIMCENLATTSDHILYANFCQPKFLRELGAKGSSLLDFFFSLGKNICSRSGVNVNVKTRKAWHAIFCHDKHVFLLIFHSGDAAIFVNFTTLQLAELVFKISF